VAEKRKQAAEKRRSEDAKKKTDATQKTNTAKKTPVKPPEEPMSLPPRRAAEPRLGTSNPVEVAATTDMAWADEVGANVVRVGVRFSRPGMFEVW
jgi:hypothetical protein